MVKSIDKPEITLKYLPTQLSKELKQIPQSKTLTTKEDRVSFMHTTQKHLTFM